MSHWVVVWEEEAESWGLVSAAAKKGPLPESQEWGAGEVISRKDLAVSKARNKEV